MLSKPHAYCNLNYFVEAHLHESLAKCTDVNGRHFIKSEAENFEFGIGNHFPYLIQFLITGPLSLAMSMGCRDVALSIRLKYSQRLNDSTESVRMHKCSIQRAKSEKTHSNQATGPNHSPFGHSNRWTLRLLNGFYYVIPIRNKSNCTHLHHSGCELFRLLIGFHKEITI